MTWQLLCIKLGKIMGVKLIINADDFGLCRGVNSAVAKAHNEGVLTSATLMANMPGAAEAVEIAKKTPSLGVGVHLNVLEGPAMSEDNQVKILLNNKGCFRYSAGKLALMIMVSGNVRKAVEIELTSQIQWIIDSGIRLTHLDSHKHFHCFGPISRIVCRLAEHFNISAIRWPFEAANVCKTPWPETSIEDKKRAFVVRTMAKLSRRTSSHFIKTDAFYGLAHTGRIDGKFWPALASESLGGIVEVMTHPGFADGLDSGATRLVEQRANEAKWLCEAETKKNLSQAGFELIHYGLIDRET